jgi:Flp pilus assembly protein TadG
MRNLIHRRRLRAQRGNALLESALVLWPFMLLVLGIVQISFAIWANGTLVYSVDTAVRYASLNGARSSAPASVDDIKQVLRDNATALETSKLTIEVTWNPNNRPGSTVKVYASYALPTLVDIVWKQSFPLQASSQMLIVN